jgi:hypothetical protein
MNKLAILLTIVLLAPGLQAEKLSGSLEDQQQQVKNLRRDIAIINLLNGLTLSRQQMNAIYELAQAAHGVRISAAGLSTDAGQAMHEAIDAFSALKQEITKGAPASGQIPKRAQQAKKRLEDLHQQIEQSVLTKMQKLERQLVKVLTPGQVYLVENFKPCLIPPDDIGNPLSIGQAEVNYKVINRLQRLRKMPDRIWEFRRGHVLERLVSRYEKFVTLTDKEKSTERARLRKVLTRVRRLSDIDFEMEKTALAEQLKPPDKFEQLHQQALGRLVRHKYKPSKLARFFLNERIIPILRKRLESDELAGN